tara:strand:- start:1241 stop:1477 length:237 start_codon:yes stop_codon:yes gene_type:complete
MFVLIKTLLFKLFKQQASKKVAGIVVEKAMQQGMAYMAKRSEQTEDGVYPLECGQKRFNVTIRNQGIVAIQPIEVSKM